MAACPAAFPPVASPACVVPVATSASQAGDDLDLALEAAYPVAACPALDQAVQAAGLPDPVEAGCPADPAWAWEADSAVAWGKWDPGALERFRAPPLARGWVA